MTLWQQRQALLTDRRFLLFLFHGFITVAAGSMGYIVLTWHVLSFHHNPLISSMLISLSFWAPSVLLSPLAGVIVDRYSRKRIIIIANVTRALAFITIAITMLRNDALWLCCLSNLMNGIIFTVLGPATMAFVREIVPNDKLLAGNSTIDMAIQLSTIVGMGGAGLLIMLLSTTVALLLIAAGIGIAIGMLMLIRNDSYEQHHHNLQTNPFRELADSWSYLLQRPLLVYIYALNTTLFVSFMVSPIVLAPFIKTALHGTGRDFTTTEVIFSIGMIMGGLIIPWIADRWGHVRCLFLTVIYTSTLFIIISINHSISLLMMWYFFLGIGLPIWAVIASLAQQHTPKDMQGRLQSLSQTLSSCGLMLVYLLLSLYGSHIPLAHCYWLCAALGLVNLVFICQIYRHAHNTPQSGTISTT